MSLDPVRARLLPSWRAISRDHAGRQVGLPQQKVNYHLPSLGGLVELVEERRKGNCTERVVRATAGSCVISPAALAAVSPT